MKRGILGIKKDPKNAVLLFTNGEPWPSDDSSDEDFVDSHDAAPSKKESKNLVNKERDAGKLAATEKAQSEEKPQLKCRMIRHHHQKGKSKQVKWEMDCGVSMSKETKKKTDGESDSTSPTQHKPWGDIIPPEVLLKIMQYVVKSEGVLPFLEIASQVNELWHDVVSHPSLWRRIDFSSCKLPLTEQFLQKLFKERFCHTKELILSGCDSQVTAATIKAIGENCTTLTTINLSGCKHLNGKVMEVLVGKCPNLVSIDLSHVSSHASSSSAVSFNSLRYIIDKCGANIKYLNLAGNAIFRVAFLITFIGESCPNLMELDLSNVMTNTEKSSVNIEKLQNGCPKLRVLRLANVQLRLTSTNLVEQAQSPGFPDLEELSIAKTNAEYFQGLDDSALERILKCSNKLKLLDVRGCSRITASGLIRFPAFDLEYLFLSQCPGAMTPGIELVMEKWSHSLMEVDFSWNTHSGESVDAAVLALVSPSQKSILHTLDLSGSAVSYESVRTVLNFCPKLASLNLSSCRGLPRGIKRSYKGEDLQKFREDMEVVKETKEGEAPDN